MQQFQPFVMERMMSKWENVVRANLSESGVHPLTVAELLALAGKDPAELGDVLLGYPQANGTPALRETIAAMYTGASADNVLVTLGAAEANYLAIRTLLAPGDEALIMRPNYMQVWGIAENHGVAARGFDLDADSGWSLDLAQLEEFAGPNTKLIAVCNPNNPTGRILTEAEMDAIVRVAERSGAWLLADEVYRGAERVAVSPAGQLVGETPSFYGRYDRVLAQGSMSKAYGLPGLRVGWSVGPASTVDDMWARHEYTTITATALANELSALALSVDVRPKLLERTRGFIRAGYPLLESWMQRHGELFRWTPPEAAAIAFMRYDLDVNSTELVEQMRDEESVLVVPGDHFGLDRHLRISFGLPADYLNDGLARIQRTLARRGAALAT